MTDPILRQSPLSISQCGHFSPASEPSHTPFLGPECHSPPRTDASSPCPGETVAPAPPRALLSQNPALFCLFITCLSPPLSRGLPDIWNRISFVLFHRPRCRVAAGSLGRRCHVNVLSERANPRIGPAPPTATVCPPPAGTSEAESLLVTVTRAANTSWTDLATVAAFGLNNFVHPHHG